MKISRPRATQLSQLTIDCNLAMGAHDITLGAGQLVDGEDVSALQAYTHDGSLVIDGGVNPSPNPSAWTDLDLSAYIGSNIALVILSFKSASNSVVAVRRNGDTEEYYATSVFTGIAHGDTIAIGAAHLTVLVCEADAAGIIEWQAEQEAEDIDVVLIGYIK